MSYPIRECSCHGEPKPLGKYDRRCRKCGASYIRLPAARVGFTGLWVEGFWLCSRECAGQSFNKEKP